MRQMRSPGHQTHVGLVVGMDCHILLVAVVGSKGVVILVEVLSRHAVVLDDATAEM